MNENIKHMCALLKASMSYLGVITIFGSPLRLSSLSAVL